MKKKLSILTFFWNDIKSGQRFQNWRFIMMNFWIEANIYTGNSVTADNLLCFVVVERYIRFSIWREVNPFQNLKKKKTRRLIGCRTVSNSLTDFFTVYNRHDIHYKFFFRQIWKERRLHFRSLIPRTTIKYLNKLFSTSNVKCIQHASLKKF